MEQWESSNRFLYQSCFFSGKQYSTGKVFLETVKCCNRERRVEMSGKVNLHTHTRLCKHAEGDVKDYCAEAVRQGLDILGMSDHSPLGDDSPVIDTRMFMHEIQEYRRQVDEARKMYPQLTVLAGFEVDFSQKLGVSFYQDHFFGDFQ